MSHQLIPNKYLDSSEVHKLRNNLVLQPEVIQLYFLVLLETGCRPSEALAIAPHDLIDASQSVFITGLKDSRDRTIALSEGLYKRLKRLEPYSVRKLFPFAIRYWQLRWNDVRPSRKNLYSLRHTFAVRLYKATRDIRLVQFALGHKSINNTLIYTEIDQTETLRKVLVSA